MPVEKENHSEAMPLRTQGGQGVPGIDTFSASQKFSGTATYTWFMKSTHIMYPDYTCSGQIPQVDLIISPDHDAGMNLWYTHCDSGTDTVHDIRGTLIEPGGSEAPYIQWSSCISGDWLAEGRLDLAKMTTFDDLKGRLFSGQVRCYNPDMSTYTDYDITVTYQGEFVP